MGDHIHSKSDVSGNNEYDNWQDVDVLLVINTNLYNMSLFKLIIVANSGRKTFVLA